MSEFPSLSGLQQDPHHGLCVSGCLSLNWEDRALYIL